MQLYDLFGEKRVDQLYLLCAKVIVILTLERSFSGHFGICKVDTIVTAALVWASLCLQSILFVNCN